MKHRKAVNYEEILGDSKRRYVGYFCSYVPEEIFHAGGYTPVRIFTRPEPVQAADSHLQSNVCFLARSGLDLALSETGERFAAFAFAHTCDTMQCLVDIFRVNVPDKAIYNLIGPVNREAVGAHEFLFHQLQTLLRDVEAHQGRRITKKTLRDSIILYNKLRQLLTELQEQRKEMPALDYYQLVQAAMLLPPEEAIPLLENQVYREAAVHLVDVEKQARPGIYLHGALLYDINLVQKIEDMGARVVGDNLCNGSRYFNIPTVEVAPKDNPLTALAQRYLGRLPCSAKHPSLDDNEGHLIREITQTGAKGVIFLTDLFCEPHNWDLLPLSTSLKSLDIPYLSLQMDSMGVNEQTLNRMQAFIEQLREGDE